MSKKPVLSRRSFLMGGAAGVASLALQGMQPVAAQSLMPMAVITPFGFLNDFSEVMNAHSGGHFRKAGLDSKVVGGSGSATAIAQLLSNQVQFLRAGSLDIFRVVATQKQPVVAIATVDQGSVFSMISHKDRPIRNGQDMKGKTIGLFSVGGTSEKLLDLMLVNANINPKDVQRRAVGGSPGSFALVEQGQIDGFIGSNFAVAALKGRNQPILAWNTDMLAPMPGQIYATSQETIQKNPELVVRFLKGLHASMLEIMASDYDKILTRMAKDFEIPGIKDRASLIAQNDDAMKLWTSEGKDNVLRNVPSLWTKGADAINRAGLFRVDNVNACYTNEFVDRALKA
jgi:ABC-type nitrate/sulfonate/bicarbonate transport system substrate-binding protein